MPKANNNTAAATAGICIVLLFLVVFNSEVTPLTNKFSLSSLDCFNVFTAAVTLSNEETSSWHNAHAFKCSLCCKWLVCLHL